MGNSPSDNKNNGSDIPAENRMYFNNDYIQRILKDYRPFMKNLVSKLPMFDQNMRRVVVKFAYLLHSQYDPTSTFDKFDYSTWDKDITGLTDDLVEIILAERFMQKFVEPKKQVASVYNNPTMLNDIIHDAWTISRLFKIVKKSNNQYVYEAYSENSNTSIFVKLKDNDQDIELNNAQLKPNRREMMVEYDKLSKEIKDLDTSPAYTFLILRKMHGDTIKRMHDLVFDVRSGGRTQYNKQYTKKTLFNIAKKHKIKIKSNSTKQEMLHTLNQYI